MTVSGDEPYNDDSQWSAEDQTLRGYCKNRLLSFPSLLLTYFPISVPLFLGLLVLIEFVIFVPFYIWAFGLYKMTPRDANANTTAPVVHSVPGFLCNVFKLFDVFGYLTYRDDDSTSKVLTA
jgi:hypothetical protein